MFEEGYHVVMLVAVLIFVREGDRICHHWRNG
jgi:hypothetical protein